jgi:uncharacterized phage protein gp47/JayE
MAGTRFLCCSDQRRAALQTAPSLNGIDYLEVSDLAAGDLDAIETAEYASLLRARRGTLLWQRKLTVFFVNPLLPAHLAALSPETLRIDGGEGADARNIGVAVLGSGAESVTLRASRRGDFSIYRLRIVTSDEHPEPPPGFDPLLAATDFSFKVDCSSDFDCAGADPCPPPTRTSIDLDYLARDYASFRRLMLDRIASLSPSWRERHAPDIGIALVELVAYVADYLSYRQDAVATEAYLGTARRRTSIRRHARLVDYPMHEGNNARAWVQVVLDDTVPASGIELPHADPVTGVTTKFLTRTAAPATLTQDEANELATTGWATNGPVANEPPEVFELLLAPGQSSPRLYPAHNQMAFYTWGAPECCLPKGATRATLAGQFERLQSGDVLMFEEVLGPATGEPGDADPAHRQAVRLTDVRVGQDPLGGRFEDPPTVGSVDVTDIEWAAADALAFPLCVSAVIERDELQVPIVVSRAHGNVVLVDHGRSLVETLPDAVPGPRLLRPVAGGGACGSHVRTPVPGRFAPALGSSPLTFAAPYSGSAAARTSTETEVGQAMPQVVLHTSIPAERWDVRRDLLRSSETSPDFVVEVADDGTALLRFGDGVHGRRTAEGTRFSARYRVGSGPAGNVGADAIAHIASATAGIDHVRNPLPAVGGVAPEHVEDVRRLAPVAFRTQERAVTADDYARVAERHPHIQRAAATFRWTGSWRTVFVTVDPLRGHAPDGFDATVETFLEPYRMAGHDVDADTPRYVPLEIEMLVCAKREYFRSDVKRALASVFRSGARSDGRVGVFHPDNFTFGQPVYLSQLYAAAYAVEGVESVNVTTFRRQGTTDTKPLADGRLDLGRLEIARLDNNPSVPDRGVFRLDVAGGK